MDRTALFDIAVMGRTDIEHGTPTAHVALSNELFRLTFRADAGAFCATSFVSPPILQAIAMCNVREKQMTAKLPTNTCATILQPKPTPPS
eukprot:1902076-Pyramimonas_sp.AAC.1